MSVATLELPESISLDRIEELKSKGVHPQVAEIDLSMVKMKIQDADEGLGWTEQECEDAELEYKRFLTLNIMYPRAIVPNTVMDNFWHYHILDTRAYHSDSEKVFGGYFHHFPYFGMRGEEDEKELIKAFERTKVLYEEAFGEPMLREGQSNCWHDCQGRCWHSCSNK